MSSLDRSCQDRAIKERSIQYMSTWDRSVWDRSSQFGTGQVKSGLVKSSQDGSNQFGTCRGLKAAVEFMWSKVFVCNVIFVSNLSAVKVSSGFDKNFWRGNFLGPNIFLDS